jgi:hypothetical protein
VSDEHDADDISESFQSFLRNSEILESRLQDGTELSLTLSSSPRRVNCCNGESTLPNSTNRVQSTKIVGRPNDNPIIKAARKRNQRLVVVRAAR